MHAHPRVGRPLLAVLISTAFAIAGCGGGGGGAATPTASPQSTPGAAAKSGGGTTLSLTASTSALKFDKSSLSAPAGKVTIDMTNPSSLQHNVAIEGNGVSVVGKIVGQGQTSSVTATLKPGTYTFYCAVDSHRQAGMEGTLTVK